MPLREHRHPSGILPSMHASPELLRTHLRYNMWASTRLLDAAARLGSDELVRDFRSADKSVLGTLAHVFAADRVWLRRIQGLPPMPFLDPEVEIRLDVLQREWPALLTQWLAWGETLQDTAATVAYRDLAGNPHTTPLWQIVLHVINHATHHRGQVSAMLRAMGHTPPPLDLIRYYREVPGSAD